MILSAAVSVISTSTDAAATVKIWMTLLPGDDSSIFRWSH